MNIQTALRLVFPPQCLACGGMVDSDFGLCGSCWRETPFVTGLVCDLCGLPLPGGAPGEIACCDACLRSPRPWRQGRAAMLYDGTARQLVLSLKHGDRIDLAGPAARWIARSLRDVAVAGAWVVPVPLHRWRLLKRRYNQSALIARSLAPMIGARAVPDLLERTRHTPSLDGRGVSERRAILDGAIRVAPRRAADIAGRHILLVDDVMTSGATLSAAAQVCLAAGAGAVSVATLARVAKGT